MSRFDELIAEHCPDGVPFARLGDVAFLARGTSLTKAKTNPGTVPVVAGGRSAAYYHDRSNRPGPTIVVAGSGAYAGFVSWWDQPIWVSDAFSVVSNSTGLLNRYCYHFLLSRQDSLHAMQSGGGVPHVYPKHVAELRIPVPPVEVQTEVVRIMDMFSQLEAELEAELESRKSQYLYYRDRLCSYDHAEVRTSTLAEVGTFFGGLTGKTKADFSAGGALYVPYTNIFSNLSVDFGKLLPVHIEADERQHALKLGDILFTGSSESRHEAGMTAVVTTPPAHPLFLNSFSIGYRLSDPSVLDPEFAKHLFRSTSMRNQIVRAANGVTRFNVSKSLLGRVRLPLPPLEKQMQVAETLDRLYSLVHDLSSGLPAEIAARRKQYEYYRERLLTFKELES